MWLRYAIVGMYVCLEMYEVTKCRGKGDSDVNDGIKVGYRRRSSRASRMVRMQATAADMPPSLHTTIRKKSVRGIAPREPQARVRMYSPEDDCV